MSGLSTDKQIDIITTLTDALNKSEFLPIFVDKHKGVIITFGDFDDFVEIELDRKSRLFANNFINKFCVPPSMRSQIKVPKK